MYMKKSSGDRCSALTASELVIDGKFPCLLLALVQNRRVRTLRWTLDLAIYRVHPNFVHGWWKTCFFENVIPLAHNNHAFQINDIDVRAYLMKDVLDLLSNNAVCSTCIATPHPARQQCKTPLKSTQQNRTPFSTGFDRPNSSNSTNRQNLVRHQSNDHVVTRPSQLKRAVGQSSGGDRSTPMSSTRSSNRTTCSSITTGTFSCTKYRPVSRCLSMRLAVVYVHEDSMKSWLKRHCTTCFVVVATIHAQRAASQDRTCNPVVVGIDIWHTRRSHQNTTTKVVYDVFKWVKWFDYSDATWHNPVTVHACLAAPIRPWSGVHPSEHPRSYLDEQNIINTSMNLSKNVCL